MIVRKTVAADIPAVAALERSEFPDGADEGMLARLLDALLLPHAPSIDVTIAAEIKATTSFFFIFVFLPFAGIFATTNIGDVLHFKL